MEGEFIISQIVLGKCSQEPEEQMDSKFVYRVNKDSIYYPKDISNIFLNRKYLGDEIVVNHCGEKEIAIITSRGCIFDCAFCGGSRACLKGYFIYGFPKETKEDFQKTFELAERLKDISLRTHGKFRASVFQFRPYHGTQLYNEIMKDTGIIQRCHFNESISQFEGRYQFNFDFGNYSMESEEVLNEYILKTQKLTGEEG